MNLDFFIAQSLNGLSHATTLFLMAAGLGLIFGVTRIVNFAHGSFYMLGAFFAAHWVTHWFPSWGESPALYALAIALAVGLCMVLGVAFERFILRRMVGSPELYALVATFGLSLVLHDGVRWIFGVEEVFAPRFPGLKGSVDIAGSAFPLYHLVTIALGPLVWLGLQAVLTWTSVGAKLRAATQDRTMLSALGVNPAPYMAAAVALGCALAGLGGALRIPVEPVNLQMDVQIIVETFVVVVTGGLGSMTGAFLAALLLGLVHAFGVALFPEATLVLVFAVMGVVLLVRPAGLLGRPLDTASGAAADPHHSVALFGMVRLKTLSITAIGLVLALFVSWQMGAYWTSLYVDALILLVFALSLQLAMSLGGLVSFGHAAFFGLGAYGAALTGLWGYGVLGVVVALGAALAFGGVVIRASGVYLAMLSLAFAQVLWAGASQWTALTGGDNGIIGLAVGGGATATEVLVVVVAVASLFALYRLTLSRTGWALQAARDAPQRASASGLSVAGLRFGVYVASAGVAGIAGVLMVLHKGSVFPSVLSVSTSLDALLVVLLGGAHQLLGTLVGSAVMTLLASELGRYFDYWRGVLGLVVLLLMLFAPRGLLGGLKVGIQFGSSRQGVRA